MCTDFFFFQAEDGIRDLVRSRGLGDVYKRQAVHELQQLHGELDVTQPTRTELELTRRLGRRDVLCLLYTSDAADERSSVDLGGRRIIKKKKKDKTERIDTVHLTRASSKRYTAEGAMAHAHTLSM